MKCQKEECEKPAVAKGYCTTHYRAEKVKLRESALKEILEKTESIKAKRPDLAPILEDLTKDAKMLFRDFAPKKLSPADEIAALKAEMAELRAAMKPPTKQTKSKS